MFDELLTWIYVLLGKASASVSVTAQNFSEAEKTQARDNIDAVSHAELQNVETYFQSCVENGVLRVRYVTEGSTISNGVVDIQTYEIEGG